METGNLYKRLEGENLSKHISVGQEVIVVPCGNGARYARGHEFEKSTICKVTKVGRKYFYLDNKPRKYGVRGNGMLGEITDYASDCTLYLTKADFELAKELNTLSYVGYDVYQRFEKMSIEDMRILKQISDKYK